MSNVPGDLQLHIKKSWFNIYEVLSKTCNHIRVEDEYKLILKGDKNIEVFADENRIDQVIINFVNNAVKYASQSKETHLTVESLPDAVKVSVQDFGEGIDEDILPKIFDRYYRSSYAGNEYSGLGLGLYICLEIVKKHDGKIGTESKKGEGSIFWFTLPKVQK